MIDIVPGGSPVSLSSSCQKRARLSPILAHVEMKTADNDDRHNAKVAPEIFIHLCCSSLLASNVAPTHRMSGRILQELDADCSCYHTTSNYLIITIKVAQL